MKKLILLTSLVLACLAQSCSDEQVPTEPIKKNLTRSEENVRVSVTNPDLISDWENIETIVLNSSSKRQPKTVTAPWKDGGSVNLPDEFVKDIRKNDGWEMLFHTFKDYGVDSGQNYMCFYNLFTGMLKIFYYCEDNGNGSTLSFWDMHSDSPMKIFDSPSFFSLADNQLTANKKLTFTNATIDGNGKITGLSKGWNGFSYQVSRYSSESLDCPIYIQPVNKNVTQYNFGGKVNGSIQGTIKTVTSTDKSITAGEKNLVEGIINKTGKDASALMNALKNANEKEWGRKFGDKAQDILSSIVDNDIFKALNSGLKLLFGRSTASTHYSKSDVYLELFQNLEITGTSDIEFTSGAPNVKFNLKDVLEGTNPDNHTLIVNNGGASVSHLGTWTLKKCPKVYYYRTVQVHPTSYTITHYPEDRVEVYGTLDAPSFWHNAYEFEIEINPDIRKYVKKVDKYLTYAICDKADGKHRNPNDVYGRYQPTTLYKDDYTHTYTLPKNKEGWGCRTPFTSEHINENVKLMYYDLGEILEGNMIAFVTVEMEIDYNGHVFNVNETRAYPVDYGYTSEYKPEEFHNPPYSFVINYGCPDRDDLWRLYNGDYRNVP